MPSGVELFHALHGVAASLFLPFRCLPCREEPVLGKYVVGHGVENGSKLFFCLSVVAVLEQQPGVGELVLRGGLSVSYGIAVGGDGFGRGIDAFVTLRHFQGTFATVVALLGGGATVCPLKLVGGIVVFAQGEVLLALLDVAVYAACCCQHAAQHHDV